MSTPPAPAPFHVRPARSGDVEEAVALLAAVAAEGHWIGTQSPLDPADAAGRLRQMIEGDDDAVFVAVAGGGLVGQLGMHRRPWGGAELGMLVAADWRGRGVGTALVEAGLGWARRAGVHKVSLQVWPHNRAARALYEKAGFVEEGYLRRHYRRRSGELWDAVVMGLVLDHTTPGRSPPAEP